MYCLGLCLSYDFFFFFCFYLQLLTNHYERCWKYYCLPNGWANFGVASEEELHLTRKLFWGIFESLAHKVLGHSFIVLFDCLTICCYNNTSFYCDFRNLMLRSSKFQCHVSVQSLEPSLQTTWTPATHLKQRKRHRWTPRGTLIRNQ